MNLLIETKSPEQLDDSILDASIRALSHRKPVDNSTPTLKLVAFSVELPEATRVQLAADFTDWEQFPLDMMRFEDGVWATTVPLPPGIYAYRFLVDGKWYDDRRSTPNEPGVTADGRVFVMVR